MRRYDLLRIPWLRRLLVSRWPQLILRALALGGFLFAILAGLLGTRVGNHNFAIVAVWIAWWAALMLVLVPFLGRAWCAICPIPMPGEWLQQGTVLSPLSLPLEGEGEGGRGGEGGGGGRFPKSLRSIWLQNVAFTLLALFSAVILTRPAVTGWVLLGMLLVALVVSLRYERRAFCRYLCPVSGFIGLYSQLAPIELRVVDTKVCAGHREKACYVGNAEAYGCPWDVFPAALKVNTNCGLCMECLRACEYENIALNLRAFGTDLDASRRGLDEAYKAFIMLGGALVYSAVMLGPWGALKTAAYEVGSAAWWGYAAALLALTWVLLPGLFYLTTRLAQALTDRADQSARRARSRGAASRLRPRQVFTRHVAALIPLGLTAWIAFSLSFVFANLSYLFPVLSDPLGWGWDLFGTAGVAWRPALTTLAPSLQVAVLVGGLYASARVARRVSAEMGAPRQAWPVIGFCALVTGVLLWLLVG